MARTPIDRLDAVIKQTLEEYAEGVQTSVNEATRSVAKAGAAAVRAGSGVFGGTGKYRKGWTYKVETRRLYSTGVIYNRTPGLPHLLENGHAKRGGGRVPGIAHIKPVEEDIKTKFEQEIRVTL